MTTYDHARCCFQVGRLIVKGEQRRSLFTLNVTEPERTHHIMEQETLAGLFLLLSSPDQLIDKRREERMMHLEIYITTQCTNCGEALLIAERARGIAGLEVAVIDLDQPGQSAPPRVFAVPTYLLDGQVVSLGNPVREAFLARLRHMAKEEVR